MNAREVERNVRLYRWFEALREPLFWGPILIHYLERVVHMKLADIYVMESVVVLLSVFLEAPTGALADLIGRKKTMCIGMVLLVAEAILFAAASAPWMAWCANIIWIIGFSLISGADNAFLYDTLKAGGQEHRNTEIRGKAMSLRLLLMAFCSLASGHLYALHPRLPSLLSLPFMAAGCASVFLMKEPLPTHRYCFSSQMRLMRESVACLLQNKQMLWLMGLICLIGATSKIWFFTYNPYFALAEIPVVYYGYIFFVLNMAAMLASRYAQHITKVLGPKRSICSMVLMMAVPIIVMGCVVSKASAFLVLCQNYVRGLSGPFLGSMFHDRIEHSHMRATIDSVSAGVSHLTQCISMFIFAALVRGFPLTTGLLALGLSFVAASVLLLKKYDSLFK
jgi:MFS family permease